MKRPKRDDWDLHGRRIHRSADGIEYYNYPSPFALKHWYYVLCLGQATMPSPYHYVPIKRNGVLLHYIRSGTATHLIRGRRYEVSRGFLCLMDLSDDITIDNVRAQPASNWWLLFNSRDLSHLFTELRADRNPVFTGVDIARFEPLFRELLALTKSRPPAYEAQSSAVIATMLAELFAARATGEQLVPLVGRRDVLSEPVRRGIDYMIRFHNESDLGLKRICDAAGLSLHHFVRLFRREMGVSPIQYLTRYRIEQAKSLLAESDKSIDQISRQVGVSSQNYFSYLFRKNMGASPREYREKVRRQKKLR